MGHALLEGHGEKESFGEQDAALGPGNPGTRKPAGGIVEMSEHVGGNAEFDQSGDREAEGEDQRHAVMGSAKPDHGVGGESETEENADDIDTGGERGLFGEFHSAQVERENDDGCGGCRYQTEGA